MIQCVVDAEGIAIDSQLATSRNLQRRRWQLIGRKLEVTKAAEVCRGIILEIPSDLTRRPYGSSAVDGSDPEKSFVCAPTDKDADVGQWADGCDFIAIRKTV